MRIAVISDIHGNLEALEAVLADIQTLNVDQIICLGDIVGYGPNPFETAELVSATVGGAIRGNHELMVCGNAIDETVTELAAAAARWTRNQLEPRGSISGRRRPSRRKRDVWRWLCDLPATLRLDDMMFAHGTPASAQAYIMSRADAQVVFQDEMDDARLLFVGHSHIPGIFHCGRSDRLKYAHGKLGRAFRVGRNRMIVNVGSVGQPRDADTRACYALVDEHRKIRYRRVAYDVALTVEKIYAEPGLPNALAERLLCGE